jgi:hypothetical protein
VPMRFKRDNREIGKQIDTIALWQRVEQAVSAANIAGGVRR